MTYALRRVLLTLPLLLVVSLLVFALTDVLPGDAADRRFEKHPEMLEKWRAERGLDDPLPVRWVRYVRGVAGGDFDRSYLTDQPVGPDLLKKLQATFELTIFAMIIAILVGGAVGILSAVFPRSPLDYAGSLLAMCGISMPVFWLGMLLMVFAVDMGFEYGSDRFHQDLTVDEFSTALYLLESPFRGRFDVFFSCLKHLLLPGVALATIPMAVITRMTRASMLEEIRKDYATTARAKGLRRRKVVLKHVLRNALIPITTITGLQFGQLMGGAVLTETVFSWPGLGSYLVQKGVLARDTPVIVGGVVLIAGTFVVVNLVVDLLYAVIDPRVRKGAA